jgi:hypothetical protein
LDRLSSYDHWVMRATHPTTTPYQSTSPPIETLTWISPELPPSYGTITSGLEGHVLEHVGEIGGVHGILGGAGIDARVEGEDWSLGAFADDQREAVGQFLDRDALFEGGNVLSGGEGREKKKERSDFQDAACRRL